MKVDVGGQVVVKMMCCDGNAAPNPRQWRLVAPFVRWMCAAASVWEEGVRAGNE